MLQVVQIGVFTLLVFRKINEFISYKDKKVPICFIIHNFLHA